MPPQSDAARWPELPLCRVEGHLRNAAPVDAGRRQGAARADALAQPFLARHAVCHRARARPRRRSPTAAATSQIEFDFIDHVLWLRTSDGHVRQLMLKPHDGRGVLRRRDGGAARARHRRCASTRCRTRFPTRCRFPRTARTRPTTATSPNASGACCCARHEVFSHFRTGFLGKASPVHFFWGSFDLAVTRFSGRPAPPHPGGVPNLPDAVAREAYSHEVSSAGFWPGGGADRLPGVLFLCLSGAGGLCARRRSAGRGVLFEGARRIHPAV